MTYIKNKRYEKLFIIKWFLFFKCYYDLYSELISLITRFIDDIATNLSKNIFN